MLCHALQGIKTCFDVYGLKMSENTPNVEIIKYYCNITNKCKHKFVFDVKMKDILNPWREFV